MPAEAKTKKKVAKKGGKKKAGAPKPSKEVQKRLKMCANALAYGVQQGFVDLERSTQVMSNVTEEEVIAVINSLMSSEKLNATTQGRQARPWAGSSEKLTNKDAKLLFKQLKDGAGVEDATGVNLQAFLDKIVGLVKVQGNSTEQTQKQKDAAAREEFLKEVEWHTMDGLVSTFPIHIQRQVELARAKKIPKDIDIENFDLRVPFSSKDYLLECAELKIPQRSKMALIGEGGSGKSVLLHAISGNEIKGFPDHLEVHHMKEIEVSPDAENLLDTVVHAHAYIMALRRAKVELENRIEGKEGHTAAEGDIKEGLIANARHVEVKLRETRSDEAEEDAAKSLRVLGFDEAAQKKSVNSLSGGLRMRVALCAAFFVGADVLLLDEPTNHLDFPSLLWLENRLRAYRGIFLMVCHDREILNNTCNSVCKITDVQSLKYYQMNYDAYEKQLAKDEKKKSQDTEKFLDRNRNVDFSSPAAREVAIKRAWLEAYNRKMVLRAGQFTLPPPTPLIPDNHQLGQEVPEKEISVIKVDNVRFSYDPITLPFIFNTPISIDITMGSRMGVMGPNGAGKSTFLKLITDRLQPVEGTITTNKNATIAYFAQHHSAEMDLNTTALEFMMSRFEEEKVANLKAHLAKVGIGGDMTNTRMTDISQGMRSCVLFAAITYVCPSLLIMDEPTNFLDIETVDALISATNKYDGALLLVSHSRQFLNRCATSYLSIVPGKFNVFRTLSECEQSTYTFIAEMEAGGKVKIGSGALAQHGANASYGGDSEKKVETKGGLTI